MRTSESVRKYGQRVKALIQKLTMEIAPSVQVEWYVAGFPEAMGFQIRQTRPANLRDSMEAAHNYENSAQSLQKAVRWKFGGTFRFRQYGEPDPDSRILVAVYEPGC
jgi:hypothetical protein